MNIINSAPLVNFNTFKVNAIAKFFVNIKSETDLLALLNNNQFKTIEKFILGGGSNILLTKNINGLVIHNQIKGINVVKKNNSDVTVEIGAGEVWDDVVKWSVENNLYGIENLSLIPGYAGAAPIQNIGAYGVEIENVFTTLEAINLNTQEKITFNKFDCKFGYRDSIFKNTLRDKFIITKIKIILSKKRNVNVSYKALYEKLQNSNQNNLTSTDIRNAVIEIRTSKLPNPKIIGNAGSFFKNPFITTKTFAELQKRNSNIPVFKKNGKIKISAAWLIEKCGWKGYTEKTCGVYKKHSLVLVNQENATGKEILKLAQKIKIDIYKKFNITLEEEVTIS